MDRAIEHLAFESRPGPHDIELEAAAVLEREDTVVLHEFVDAFDVPPQVEPGRRQSLTKRRYGDVVGCNVNVGGLADGTSRDDGLCAKDVPTDGAPSRSNREG